MSGVEELAAEQGSLETVHCLPVVYDAVSVADTAGLSQRRPGLEELMPGEGSLKFVSSLPRAYNGVSWHPLP